MSDGEPQTISLHPLKIEADVNRMARARIDKPTVHRYADILHAGGELPPVDAVYDGSTYWLWDGWHRLHAALEIGLPEIAVRVTPGTKAHAELLAAGANKSHGLNRSNADEAKTIRLALQNPHSQGLSDQEIAEHCGVSVLLIPMVRAKMIAAGERIGPIAPSKSGTKAEPAPAAPKRTNAEKQADVRQALRDPANADADDWRIADLCTVSVSMVRRYRAELAAERVD